jgi:hypothetical protein
MNTEIFLKKIKKIPTEILILGFILGLVMIISGLIGIFV